MIYGIGVDIEDHRRFEKYINSGDGLEHLLPIYSANELQNYSQYKSSICYALSFSCKESVFKAFGKNWDDGCILSDIELIFLDYPERNRAQINFRGHAKQLIEKENLMESIFFKYHIDKTKVIFQSILLCKEN